MVYLIENLEGEPFYNVFDVYGGEPPLRE